MAAYQLSLDNQSNRKINIVLKNFINIHKNNLEPHLKYRNELTDFQKSLITKYTIETSNPHFIVYSEKLLKISNSMLLDYKNIRLIYDSLENKVKDLT